LPNDQPNFTKYQQLANIPAIGSQFGGASAPRDSDLSAKAGLQEDNG
jgi:hypothetical protein